MSSTVEMFDPCEDARPIAFRGSDVVTRARFRDEVAALYERLPAAGPMINLCEDRYRFLAAYAAAVAKRHTVLLPPSRAEHVIDEVRASHPGSYIIDDAEVAAALEAARPSSLRATPDPNDLVMIGFTSGSTGQAKQFPKTLRAITGSNNCNVRTIRSALSRTDAQPGPWIVATVPPQHMYGMELSILLPLFGGMAIHSGRPLFPADIAQALEQIPEPRVLVSTPVHLRAMVASEQRFPRVALIVSATAPLDAALARDVECVLQGEMLELFGSTETCVFAHRYTARENAWRLYPGVTLTPQSEGTLVEAPWFDMPTLLQDFVELKNDGTFTLRGRNTDLIEVAGKRASLADLTRRILDIKGVADAVVFQPEAEAVATIRRVAALVVAPSLTPKQILEELAASVDPAFLPRPLVIVERLPRNEVGKLPRERLLAALKRAPSG
jgi:acyl-coenzyme A synthetase/AMP-(fatty) acid ligase